ncbi:hypothetical protein ACT691_00375 [Vibrio metschnikovii]
MESSTRFVDKVISEVAAMHIEAGAPLTTMALWWRRSEKHQAWRRLSRRKRSR